MSIVFLNFFLKILYCEQDIKRKPDRSPENQEKAAGERLRFLRYDPLSGCGSFPLDFPLAFGYNTEYKEKVFRKMLEPSGKEHRYGQ